MDKVKFYEETIYVWDCPKCGKANETMDDPESFGMFCEKCGEEFEPEQG